MKEQFKEYLLNNNLATQHNVDILLSKLSDKLDIIGCNDVEKEVLENLLSPFLDLLSTKDYNNLL